MTDEPLNLDPKKRAELEAIVSEIENRGLTKAVIQDKAPQNDDELWQAVFDLSGWRIPRVSVCRELGHIAPFQIFADLYFDRRTDVLWIANRGAGKTTNSGLLHACKARYKPGYKSLVAGALAQQARRCHTAITRFTSKIQGELADDPTLREIQFRNGSAIENVVATVKALNGPHPYFSQLDEAELVKTTGGEDPFEEFLNMSQGDELYVAQNLLTSTRKWSFGRVQRIVKETDQSIRDGDTPAWDVCISCIFEVMQKVPNCGDGCGCDKVVKGTVERLNPETGVKERVPRTFMDVCGGRAKLSDGHIRLEDVHRRFRQLGISVWEAQMECLKPNPEGLVHMWLNERYLLDSWKPNPDYGMIIRTWDWGGTNPHAVLFSQLLRVDVDVPDGTGGTIRIPEGSLVTFDEIYGNKDKIGGIKRLAEKVVKRTRQWRTYGYDIEIAYDFCDPAGASARIDVKDVFIDMEENAPNFKHRKAPRVASIQKHVEWGEDGRLFFVQSMCQNTIDEFSGYHYKQNSDGTWSEDAVEFDDHAADSHRYGVWNLAKMLQNDKPMEVPSAVMHGKDLSPRVARKNDRDGAVEIDESYVVEAPSSTMSRSSIRSRPYRSVR